MESLQPGQCGLCSHFGETHASSPILVSILERGEADLRLLEACGHPRHAGLHLQVTPNAGCTGFTPAAAA